MVYYTPFRAKNQEGRERFDKTNRLRYNKGRKALGKEKREQKTMKKERVIAAMSGGVDSSAAAKCLLDAGADVLGVTFRMFSEGGVFRAGSCAEDAAESARGAADALGIPHRVYEMHADFDRAVIRPFIEAYERGETPNPCVECNRCIKFPVALRCADELGYDKIATGHYACVTYDTGSGRYLLARAKDDTKDQTYMLYSLPQSVLSRLLLPLGGLTKPEVRELARAAGLSAADRKDSQDICFIPDGDYVAFMERYRQKSAAPGDFVDKNGAVLGRHRGIPAYTVGQRKGLGIALGKPMFVLAKDAKTNTVTLGEEADLFSARLVAKNINLIAAEKLTAPIRCTAKTRYSHKGAAATVEQTGEDELTVLFDAPQRAITPGQALVLYDGDTVIGGGTIV